MQVDAASFGHLFDTEKRLQRAEEHAAGLAFPFARNIQAIVISVDEINISVAGRTEEYGVAKSASGGRMGGRVVFAEVGLNFDDAGGQ